MWHRQKRRRPREDGGRGWSHKPEYTWGLQKLEDPRNVTSLRASGRECDSADTLIWDFWHSETWENKFLLFWVTKFAVICCRSPRKQIYIPTHIFWAFPKVCTPRILLPHVLFCFMSTWRWALAPPLIPHRMRLHQAFLVFREPWVMGGGEEKLPFFSVYWVFP